MTTKTEELRSDLMAVAQAYCAAADLKLSSLGQYILGRSRYFEMVASGECTLVAEVYDRCLTWMSEKWPTDSAVKWPPHVARPAPQPKEAAE